MKKSLVIVFAAVLCGLFVSCATLLSFLTDSAPATGYIPAVDTSYWREQAKPHFLPESQVTARLADGNAWTRFSNNPAEKSFYGKTLDGKPVILDIAPETVIHNLRDLFCEYAVSFRSVDMPEDVRSVLQQYKTADGITYYEYVVSHSDRIFVCPIISGRLRGLANYRDNTYTGERLIRMNNSSFDLRTSAGFVEFLVVLIHEAGHNYQGDLERAKIAPKLLASKSEIETSFGNAFRERFAELQMIAFSKILREHTVELANYKTSSGIKRQLDLEINVSAGRIATANRVLGSPVNNHELFPKEIYFKDELSKDGFMLSATTSKGRITGYTGRDASVVIPATIEGKQIVAIGKEAFKSRRDITSVSIPTGVTIIESDAFSGCTGLTSVSIPVGVTSIEGHAFSDCTGLTSVSIPAGVTSIESWAFSGCTGLTSVSIPAGVTSIWSAAFSRCTGLTSVSIGANVVVYRGVFDNKFDDYFNANGKKAGVYTQRGGAWSYAAVAQTAPSTTPIQATRIESLSEKDFKVKTKGGKVTITGYTGSAADVVIPATIKRKPVTSIGEDTFRNNTGLTSVSIPASVTSIGRIAFGGCTGLTSVSIPASVTSIGRSAFWGCTGLTSIQVDANNKNYSNRDGVLFSKIGDILIEYPGGKQERQYTIPAGVTSIGGSAFSGCTRLTSVSIPAGVTSIEKSAFSGCTGLTSVSIPAGVTSIGYGVFEGCTGLTSVSIPASVTSIERFAFVDCTGLTSVSIPVGVTSIGGWAFEGCTGLTSVNIPASVTSIGSFAFYRCTGLTAIQADANNQAYSSRGGVLLSKTGDTLIAYPAGLKGQYAIPASVTSIGSFAFYGCTGLTSVSIPAGVTSIGISAFGGCTGLTSIRIGANVKLSGSKYLSFDNKFDDYYDNNGKKAGVYTWRGGAWSYAER
ncbi:MAG: hypothetical protein Ta2G_20880 [Termitinemataceae bacterium]|nr:MAG: hypothetical protein Ta2G_20880 [Termitinemataceae bacterium]